jgi:hypothetical protein
MDNQLKEMASGTFTEHHAGLTAPPFQCAALFMGASGNFLTAVGRVTSRGARVKEIAASGDAVYNQNAVTGGSLM